VGCEIEFSPQSFNQKYHNELCRKEATNRRLMEKYHERRRRRNGEIRICKTEGCETKLSRYNESTTCEKCVARHREAKRRVLLDMFV
jgi:hypothetical protein